MIFRVLGICGVVALAAATFAFYMAVKLSGTPHEMPALVNVGAVTAMIATACGTTSLLLFVRQLLLRSSIAKKLSDLAKDK